MCGLREAGGVLKIGCSLWAVKFWITSAHVLYTHIHTCTHAFPQNVTIWVVLLKYFWLFCLFFLLWWLFFLNQNIKTQQSVIWWSHSLLSDTWTESCNQGVPESGDLWGTLIMGGFLFLSVALLCPSTFYQNPRIFKGMVFSFLDHPGQGCKIKFWNWNLVWEIIFCSSFWYSTQFACYGLVSSTMSRRRVASRSGMVFQVPCISRVMCHWWLGQRAGAGGWWSQAHREKCSRSTQPLNQAGS